MLKRLCYQAERAGIDRLEDLDDRLHSCTRYPNLIWHRKKGG